MDAVRLPRPSSIPVQSPSSLLVEKQGGVGCYAHAHAHAHLAAAVMPNTRPQLVHCRSDGRMCLVRVSSCTLHVGAKPRCPASPLTTWAGSPSLSLSAYRVSCLTPAVPLSAQAPYNWPLRESRLSTPTLGRPGVVCGTWAHQTDLHTASVIVGLVPGIYGRGVIISSTSVRGPCVLHSLSP